MGVMLAAGGSLRWLRDTLCAEERAQAAEKGIDPYEVMIAEAARVATSEGLVFLPYLTGERTPYPNPNARGVFFGLSLRHTKAHMLRAVLEGVAFGMRDSFEIIKGMGVEFVQVRASGGGARSRVWRQIQANVSGEGHCVINVDEGPALGVALLAGVGAGVYGSVPEACQATIRALDEVAPQASEVARYQGYYQLYRGLYRQLKESFDEAQNLVAAEHAA